MTASGHKPRRPHAAHPEGRSVRRRVLIQVALLAVMVIDRVQILRDGAEVTLQTRPVDPRDLLRGDYVVLRYDISEVPAGPLKDQPARARNAGCSSSSRPIATASTRRSRSTPIP